MTSRVQATPRALEELERLKERHGALVIHQSGGCCDGSSPICLPAAELPAGPGDVLLGKVSALRSTSMPTRTIAGGIRIC